MLRCWFLVGVALTVHDTNRRYNVARSEPVTGSLTALDNFPLPALIRSNEEFSSKIPEPILVATLYLATAWGLPARLPKLIAVRVQPLSPSSGAFYASCTGLYSTLLGAVSHPLPANHQHFKRRRQN